MMSFSAVIVRYGWTFFVMVSPAVVSVVRAGGVEGLEAWLWTKEIDHLSSSTERTACHSVWAADPRGHLQNRSPPLVNRVGWRVAADRVRRLVGRLQEGAILSLVSLVFWLVAASILATHPAATVVWVPAGLSLGTAAAALFRILPVGFYVWRKGWPP